MVRIRYGPWGRENCRDERDQENEHETSYDVHLGPSFLRILRGERRCRQSVVVFSTARCYIGCVANVLGSRSLCVSARRGSMQVSRSYLSYGLPLMVLAFVLAGQVLPDAREVTLKVHGQFVPHSPGCNGTIALTSRDEFGSFPTISHEMMHALRQCGVIGRDVPTAAAFGQCDTHIGAESLQDPMELVFIRTRVLSRLEQVAFGRIRSETNAGREIDSLMRTTSRYVEHYPESYRRGAQIAGLAISHLNGSFQCSRFVIALSNDVPARFAFKAARDSVYFNGPSLYTLRHSRRSHLPR